MAEEKKPTKINAQVEQPSVMKGLGKYAWDEIILPKSLEVASSMFTGIINMFAEAARASVDKLLYPNGGAPANKPKSTGFYTTNYTSYSKPIGSSTSQRDPIGSRSGNEVKCFWVSSEEEARDVISTLQEEIDNYNKAKVATLYEKLGERTTFADFKYGWTDADALRYYYDTSRIGEQNKWFIDLPKPKDISNI